MTPTEAAAEARRLLRAGMFPDPTPHDPPETTTMTTTAPTALTHTAWLMVSNLLARGRGLLAATKAVADAEAAEAARALEAAADLARGGYQMAADRVLPECLSPYATFVEDREVLTITLALPGLEPISCRSALQSRAYGVTPAIWVRPGEDVQWAVSTYLLADGEYRSIAVYSYSLAEALALAEEAASTRVLYDVWLADRV